MEMDGLTAPRLAFLFHAGLWLPAPHEKHLLPMAGSPVFAFAQQKSTIQAGPCKLQSVSRFGFGDGKTKAQSSVYLTYPVSAGITVTNSPGFSPDSAADAQGAGRSVLLLTWPYYICPATKSKHYFFFSPERPPFYRGERIDTKRHRLYWAAEKFSHMLSLSFRDQSAGWSWESVPSLQVFFSFRRVLFFCRERPPAAHFSHQLEKWAKAHTVVSAGFQPRCGVKIGTLPRNHLASSATGGASAVSSQ